MSIEQKNFYAHLFYKGQTLRSYCIQKGYNYNIIVNRLKKKFSSIEDAVKSYEDYDLKGKKIPRTALWNLSDGRTLAKACIEEKVPYKSALDLIHKGVSVDEAFIKAKNVVGKKSLNNAHHFYKGQTLRSYLKLKDYEKALHLMKNKNMSIEEAVQKVEKDNNNEI